MSLEEVEVKRKEEEAEVKRKAEETESSGDSSLVTRVWIMAP
jgi:hypothetical protein